MSDGRDWESLLRLAEFVLRSNSARASTKCDVLEVGSEMLLAVMSHRIVRMLLLVALYAIVDTTDNSSGSTVDIGVAMNCKTRGKDAAKS
jgi:hypothetical protein